MKKKKTLYITVLIVLLICVLAVPALADAGNFSGGSDFGGSSFGGSSFGGSDYGGSSFGGSAASWALFGLSSGGGSVSVISIIIIIVIILNVLKNARRRSPAAPFSGASTSSFSALEPISSLRAQDPQFSEAAIKEKIANLYVRMQSAWQDKEFGSMRPFMTDALYNQFMLQLDELIRSNCTNHVERIAVLDVTLLGWRSDEANDVLVAEVKSRIIDYISNDKTGKVISGSQTTEKFMTYEWTLIRSRGMKTPASAGKGKEGTATIHCPSCGAPIEINQSAKCPYCDSVINSADYDWVISAIKGLSQRTGY